VGLVVVLASRQRWFDAGLGDRIERNPQIVCAGRGRARILCSGPYAGGRGGTKQVPMNSPITHKIFSRISGRCGLDKGLPLDPVCRQQIDGKFRSQILTGEPAQTTNFRPLVFD